MVHIFRMLFIWFLLLSYLRNSTSSDNLAVSQYIRDGETLVSEEGTFEVGFFSPGASTGRYLGIWYRNLSPLTVVWVANRENALQNKSGVLKLDEKGVLVILNGTNNTIWWSNNTSSKAAKNPIAQILDSGNIVVRNERDINEDNFFWQSFDYPCDTFLPGMKIGWKTGLDRTLSSWKNEDDPAKGEYSMKLDLRGYPQFFGYKGDVITFRGGSWNGQALVGYPIRPPTQQYVYDFVFNEKEVYVEYKTPDRSIFIIITLTPSGSGFGNVLLWTKQTRNIEVLRLGESDQCENYAICGANSICNMDGNSQTCDCIKGYVPKFPEQRNVSYLHNGCVPRNKFDCKSSNTDGFLRYTDLKLPDTSSSWLNKTMNLDECQKSCLKNCSCKAYANADIRNGGSGCLLWFDDLIDMRKFSLGGQDIYFRVPASELDHVAVNGHGKNMKKMLGITVGTIILGLTACACIIMILKMQGRIIYRKHFKHKLRKEGIDLSTFDFLIIARATENFAESNKLGEGGFGPVYKGRLKDGQEFAVKRLSKKSGQGLEEFKNEVVLIAKLQHRNLVKLIGCCIEGNERMLIYEYMPNKSLDNFIFHETQRNLVDWPKRFNIICGIARGLLYLHQDSRLRIVHRDLKTSNILLDANLDPKISDFGLARTLWGDQVEANTNRVAGTYGYMPPEYAARGHFSMKSDVFSYGVILLEIVSGQRNREFSDPKHNLNLLGYAWRLWTEERALELLEGVLRERLTPSEVIRCIQVGLLCVQQRPEDRPDMSSVVLMLNGEKLLPNPNVPGFYTERAVTPESDIKPSSNQLSITLLEAR
ncbi:G-type lectin S-receptor-like serine/threonine-protein kinase At4g27290 [Glycine soja]|uniref:Receptor-like serine/threonine-protein kinase n=1 Tax=Glycine soja TaxID=3848 RepID=A0A445HQ72_GLYSO|nr:G-type lectin S-receptor-like serine/threonine-protein kinase At4g27290 [Glycine soja]RZB75853.1 G-type lectin S-receptor-like serine/threonine-protein kinase isoform A [Glycine soja]RZB75854.1 G-type lectin S-receptor-like serine/threonine-protein kinase isoform B [Glycine soja]